MHLALRLAQQFCRCLQRLGAAGCSGEIGQYGIKLVWNPGCHRCVCRPGSQAWWHHHLSSPRGCWAVTDGRELVLSCLLLPHLITCPSFLSLTQKEKQFFWRTCPFNQSTALAWPTASWGEVSGWAWVWSVLTFACSEWGWLPLARSLLWGLRAVAGSRLHVLGAGQALVWWSPAAQWSIHSVCEVSGKLLLPVTVWVAQT